MTEKYTFQCNGRDRGQQKVTLRSEDKSAVPKQETNILKDELFQFMNSLDPTEIDIFLGSKIRENDHQCKIIAKYANILGCGMTYGLQMAIKNHNLSLMIECIRYGADINHMEHGSTYIHQSVMDNNLNALKYFLSKGIDVNHVNDDSLTATEIALSLRYYESMKLLIKNGAHPYDIMDDGEKVYHIEILMNSYEPNICDDLILEVIEKTDPMIRPSEEMFAIIEICIKKHYEIVGAILLHFPNYVNTIIEKKTLLLMLLNDWSTKSNLRLTTEPNLLSKEDNGQTKLVEDILKLNTTNLNPGEMTMTYLDIACYRGNVSIINLIIQRMPKLVNKRCCDKRTPIDYVLLGYDSYTFEELKDTILLLLRKIQNTQILNNRNALDFRTLETAIQYTDHHVIKFLIDHGISINENIIDPLEYDFHSQIQKNDPLAFASQLNRTEIIKVLLESGVTINLFEKQPTALLSAINNNCIQAIETLLENQRIKDLCQDESVRDKLFNFSLNNGANKEIMRHFIDEDKLINLQINTDTILLNKIDRFLDRLYDYYQDDKKLMYGALYDMIKYYKYLSEIDVDENKDNIKSLPGIVSKYYDTICGIRDRDMYYQCVISECLNYESIQGLRICDDQMNVIIRSDDPVIVKQAWDILLGGAKILKTVKHRFDEVIKALKSNKNIKYIPDETVEHTLHYEDDENYINKVLIPLMYPNKVPHYDLMYERLMGSNCTISETASYIFVRDNISNIISIIFNQGNRRKPINWFKYYNHNIGKEAKTDTMHLFPFVLDKKLKDIGCYQKGANDNVNQYGKIQLISFLGMLIHLDKHILGIYEYYIDATGLLFHRFFKPLDQINDKMRINLGISTKSEKNKKYNLAKELVNRY